MKEQILRNLIRESIKKMISETKSLNEYSGDSGLEELIEVLGYSDVMDFFEDNSGAVEAVISWAESIPQLRQKMKQAGMTESTLKEAEQTVKSEAASRLADFFRVPVHTLDKFNFDGNDNIQALSAALNSTSTQGTEMYYKMAIQLAKEELGVEESKIKEAINVNKRITTQQATKIAEKFAQYMSNKENKKFAVTKNSVDGPSFDLDVNGVEYDGGSYLIDTKGDIINVAITPNEVYGNISMLESNLKEGDMTRQYDGFIVLDVKDQKIYKFRYIKGVNNVTAENDAIAKVMRKTGKPRAAFMVHGSIKKGEWDKSDVPTLESVNKSTNVMETKIKEAGGRRFIKSENIRQYNASKIKEANKKK
jgi:hypothetical protein